VNAINKLLGAGLLNCVKNGSETKLQDIDFDASGFIGLLIWFIKNILITEAIRTPAK
jgi:hypothetical protein